MGELRVEIPEPERNENTDDARDSLAFAELSEVHSDRAGEHSEEAEEAAEEAEAASEVASEAAVIAAVAAAEATDAAEENQFSNSMLMSRLDSLPGEIALAMREVLSAPLEEEPIVDESGEVVPIVPDEAPQTKKRWHHNLIGGSGGIYRGK